MAVPKDVLGEAPSALFREAWREDIREELQSFFGGYRGLNYARTGSMEPVIPVVTKGSEDLPRRRPDMATMDTGKSEVGMVSPRLSGMVNSATARSLGLLDSLPSEESQSIQPLRLWDRVDSVGGKDSQEPQTVPFQGRHMRHKINDKSAKYSKAERFKSVQGRRSMMSNAPSAKFQSATSETQETRDPPPSGSRSVGMLRDKSLPDIVSGRMTEVSDDDPRKYPWQRSRSEVRKQGPLIPQVEPYSRLKSFVESATFDTVSAILIILNAAFIGVQTDIMSRNMMRDTPPTFRTLEVVFCVSFTIELACRILVYKLKFFVSNEWRWNVFDFFLVATQWVEEAMTWSSQETELGNFSTVRILRILRLIRIIRLVRVLRLIGELRSIVVSIIGSLRSLAWTILLLLGVMYVIGVYLTQLTFDYLLEQTVDGGELVTAGSDLRHYYGSIGSSLLTLYQAITGGLNWYMITDPLMTELSPWLSMVICSYIAFCLFALMNIVTGVFVESALQTAKSDRDTFMLHFVRQLFLKADADGSGFLTWDKFKATLDSDEMGMYFEAMDLDIDEAEDLFRLLDADGSGEVDFDEFVNGCFRLRGSAKAIDLAAFMAEYSVGWAQHQSFQKRVEQALGWLIDCMACSEGGGSFALKVMSGQSSVEESLRQSTMMVSPSAQIPLASYAVVDLQSSVDYHNTTSTTPSQGRKGPRTRGVLVSGGSSISPQQASQHGSAVLGPAPTSPKSPTTSTSLNPKSPQATPSTADTELQLQANIVLSEVSHQLIV